MEYHIACMERMQKGRGTIRHGCEWAVETGPSPRPWSAGNAVRMAKAGCLCVTGAITVEAPTGHREPQVWSEPACSGLASMAAAACKWCYTIGHSWTQSRERGTVAIGSVGSFLISCPFLKLPLKLDITHGLGEWPYGGRSNF